MLFTIVDCGMDISLKYIVSSTWNMTYHELDAPNPLQHLFARTQQRRYSRATYIYESMHNASRVRSESENDLEWNDKRKH